MKYIIALNCYDENKDSNQSDFFSKEEMNEINELVNELDKDIKIIDDELNFIEQMEEYNQGIKVLNLTRQGSFNNKKVLVTSYCDLRNIPCIASSSFTVNACRNKSLMSKISSNESLWPKNYVLDDLEDIYRNEIKVISKQIQGAGSLGMNDNSLGKITKIDDTYYLNNTNLDACYFKDHVLQEFVKGTEIEVPFVIINGQIIVLGCCELNYEEEFLTEALSDSFEYGVSISNKYDTEFLKKTIESVCNDFLINYYGRVDFRVENPKDTNSYRIFDIATTPYFIENTSFAKSFKNSDFSSSYKNVLDFILSLE